MKLICFIVLLGLGAGAQAQSSTVAREKISLSTFSKIRVDADINVVLYEDSSSTATIEARDAKMVDEITLTVRNGELVVGSSQKRNYRKKAIVSIPVKGLKRIDLNADAMIVSVNVLQSSRIDVAINSECWMNIRLLGSINVLPGDGWGMVSTTNPMKEILVGYSK